MDSTLNAELQERLSELQEIFHQQIPGKLDEIHRGWQELSSNWSIERLGYLHRQCHSLAGSSGTFGAQALSQASRTLELRLKELAAESTPPTAEEQRQLGELLDTVSQAAERWTPTRPPVVAPEMKAEPIPENTQQDLVFIVEDDLQIARQYEQILSNHGYQVQHFTSPAPFASACREVLPSAIVMNMVFADGSTSGDERTTKVHAATKACPNTIFVSERNDIEARLAALRAGARRYLTKPVDPGTLLRCIDHLTGRRDAHPFRVLIIDDDDTLAQFHSEILESHGIETRIINNPMMALEVIEEYEPELVLLDIYMDECSGTELAAVIRQDDSLAHMPIVFLSEELDMGHQLSALHIGGDEFITKPVDPDYLVEMLTARLKRSRSAIMLNRQHAAP